MSTSKITFQITANNSAQRDYIIMFCDNIIMGYVQPEFRQNYRDQLDNHFLSISQTDNRVRINLLRCGSWYPLYQRGNPQLRIFLPNFWMKLVRPEEKQPKNVVQFMVPTGMTNYDIENYLKKIYKVNVIKVESNIENGKMKRSIMNKYGPIVKEDDFRRAFVTMPRDQEFEFPDVCTTEEYKKRKTEDEKSSLVSQDMYKEYLKKQGNRPGLPGWFSF